jgi:hypothetical protein
MSCLVQTRLSDWRPRGAVGPEVGAREEQGGFICSEGGIALDLGEDGGADGEGGFVGVGFGVEGGGGVAGVGAV